MNLGLSLLYSAERTPAAEAVCDDDRRLSYRELVLRAAALAQGLAMRGVRRRDKVAMILANRLEAVEVYSAVQWLGAVIVPLSWRVSPAEAAYCVSDSGSVVVFFEAASAAHAAELRSGKGAGIRLIGVGDSSELGVECESFEALFGGAPGSTSPLPGASAPTSRVEALFGGAPGSTLPEPPSIDLDEGETSIILYTSGTTGQPKGVPRSHAAERAAAISHCFHQRYELGERTLGVMPLYHTMGIHTLLATQLVGGLLVCMPSWSADEAWRLIEAEAVTSLFLAPTLFHDLVMSPRMLPGFSSGGVSGCFPESDLQTLPSALPGFSPVGDSGGLPESDSQTLPSALPGFSSGGVSGGLPESDSQTLPSALPGFSSGDVSGDVSMAPTVGYSAPQPVQSPVGVSGGVSSRSTVRYSAAQPVQLSVGVSGGVSTVRRLAYAGAAMTPALVQRCVEVFTPGLFVNHYGSTEVYTYSIHSDQGAAPGCAGRSAVNARLRLVRTAPGTAPDDEVALGEVGEIICHLSSPEAFAGYHNRADADAKSIRDGWFFTGDLGYQDADGNLWVVGRIDDMIISGGENIYPLEVEDVLCDAPGVLEAAVVGLPDDRLGQVVTAFVVLEDLPTDDDACSAAARHLESHCLASGALARFKRPRSYRFVASLPKSPSGKILRRELRE